jgi:oligoendopeptidase F
MNGSLARGLTLRCNLKKLIWLLSIVALGALGAESDYQYDLARLFPSDQAERDARANVLERLDAFERDETPVDASETLLRRLHTYENLLRGLRKHEAYVYLQAERDSEDRDAAAAETQLSAALGRTRLAIQKTLSLLDETTPVLVRYRLQTIRRITCLYNG